MIRSRGIALGIMVLLGATAAGCGLSPNTTNTSNTTANVSTNTANANVAGSNANTNTSSKPTILIGKVFVKGYNSPSASYGLLSTDGREIGLGAYDSMSEQIRAYVGERITVTFSSICESSKQSCCRTLFALCGTVASWKPYTPPAP